MKHRMYIDADQLAKEFLGAHDIRIEFRITFTDPPKFIAMLRIDGIRGYDGIASDPLLAVEKAFFQIAGKNVGQDDK